MSMRAFQIMIAMTVLLAAGFGCFQAISATQSEPDPDTTAPVLQAPETASSAPLGEPPPPTTRPELAPTALEPSANIASVLSTSPALEGAIHQLRAGVEEEVLLTYINNSETPFNVGSEEIIYLTDLGAPGRIINAMMEHDQQLSSGSSAYSSTTPSHEPWPAAGTVAQVPAAPTHSKDDTLQPHPEVEPVVIDPPATEVSVDYFYEYLSPYGTWVNIPEYGLCWQPGAGVATTGWMPYGDRGRWVYTNYGWYWYSDYSWGWATFHYGRWHHNPRWGWCWVPGTVWGPSWVSWRYTDAYCGWAPLPPYTSSGFYFSVGLSWGIPSWCYTYVPVYNVCTYYPRKCAVPYSEARRIHGRARAYDNYSVDRNNRIHNQGIPPETLARNSDTKIQRAQIKERNELPAGTIRRERLDNDGKTLTVYQPRATHRDGTSSSPSRSRNATRPASGDTLGNSESSRMLGGGRVTPSVQSEPRPIATAGAGSTPRSTYLDRAQPGTDSGSVNQAPSRVTSRTEPTPRERTMIRSSSQPQSVSVERSRPATTPASQPASSLVIIGGNRSRSATHAPSKSAVTEPISSTPRSTANTTSSSRARPSTPTTRSGSPASSRIEPIRPSTRVSPSTTQTPSVTRTTPISTSRSAPPAMIRSQTTPRREPTSPLVRTAPTQRPAYNAPAQRITVPSSPSRTSRPPSQPARSASTVRRAQPTSPTSQRAPSVSRPSVPSQPSGPAPTRAAPPTRSGTRSRDISR